MLEKCPYYEICEAEIRHARGNSEHHCLGAISWDYCPQFKEYSLKGISIHHNGRDAEIIMIGRAIYDVFQTKMQPAPLISLITSSGEIIYQDMQISTEKLELAMNLAKALHRGMAINDYLKIQNEEDILIFKMLESVLLICLNCHKIDDIPKFIAENLGNVGLDLENYLNGNPLRQTYPESEDKLLNILTNLQEKLEGINSTKAIKDLKKLMELFSTKYSGSDIPFEIASIIGTLEKVPAEDKLTANLKDEILVKIKDWHNRIQ